VKVVSCVDDPSFPVEQIVYVPCLMKVIAPDKLVRSWRLGVKKVTKDEMKDVLVVHIDLTLLNPNRFSTVLEAL
jgi:hypothetical protein